METIFSKIIAGDIPCAKVHEDNLCIVIMDAFPSVPGQTLVIPKEPTDYIFDLGDATYQHILQVAKTIAKASDVAFNTSRTCVVVEGFEVPHTHIKLYPLSKDQTALTNVLAQTNPGDPEELQKNADAIIAAL